MKKKHRRAVYDTISVIICMIFSPIATWLKTKLRVYDTDPE